MNEKTTPQTWQERISHRMDELSPEERHGKDCAFLSWVASSPNSKYKGERHEVWIEEQYMGQAQFSYRVGKFDGSSRYRFVGYTYQDGTYKHTLAKLHDA